MRKGHLNSVSSKSLGDIGGGELMVLGDIRLIIGF